MKFILGKKIGMTQVFNKEGDACPVTVLEIEPTTVTQVKTPDRDGYSAVQIGARKSKPEKLKNPQKGHFKDTDSFKSVKEFRVPEKMLSEFKVGDKFDVTTLSEEDIISVSSVSKGKGFQGVVKRHGFGGGPRTHGQKHSEREPGSIGIGGVQRVFKGKKMPGRMGGERVTVKNLKIVQIVPKENQLFVGGAIPGRRGVLVEIRSNSSS